MNDLHAKILARVFVWAWENRIDVELTSYQHTLNSSDRVPELQFSRNGNRKYSLRFYNFDEIGPRMEYQWAEIVRELCATPLNLKDL